MPKRALEIDQKEYLVALLQVKAERDEVAAKIGKSGESEDEDEGGAESGDVSSGLAALAAAMSGDGEKKKKEEPKKSEWKPHADPDVEVMDSSLSKDDLKKLSIKELREKCKEMGKDASKCTDKDDLIAVIQDQNAPKAAAAAAAAAAPAPSAGGVHHSPSSQRARIPHKFETEPPKMNVSIVFFWGSKFCARADGFRMFAHMHL